MNIKQVIIIRKDLKMRRGKEIAQGSHASIAWLTKRLQNSDNYKITEDSLVVPNRGLILYNGVLLTPIEQEWTEGVFTKVCLQVDSEKELLNIFNNAKEADLEVNLITDSGLTEFGGQPTNTCLAIGPDLNEKIDPLTKHLKLY